MSQATLRVQKISGHAGSVPGRDTQRESLVCKLIDTTDVHRVQSMRSRVRRMERHAIFPDEV